MNQEIKERIELINKGIVPAGYKKTPVGICPVEWEDFYLKDLYDFYGGLGIPREKLGNKGIPYLHYGDMHISEKMYVNLDRDIDKLPKYDKIVAEDKMLLNGDIVFVDASEDYEGTCKTFVVYNKNKLPFISGLHTFFGRNKTSLIHIDFQKYLTKIPEIKKQIFKYVQGYKVYGISRENLQKVNINLPSYHEQEKIAEILDCATRQVELQEQLVDKLKVQKKALMQKLLTPQPDWQKLKLKNIINFYNGYSFKSETYVKNGAFYVITISNVKDDGFILQEDTSTIEKIPTDIRDYQILRKGDILISMTGNVGRVCKVECDNCLLNQRVGKIEVKKEFDKNFIFYSLQSYSFVEKMKLLAQGAAQDNMSVKDINNYIIYLPKNKEIQSNISNLLSNIDKRIELQQKLLEQYKLRQKSLMQLLLTGIVRVC